MKTAPRDRTGSLELPLPDASAIAHSKRLSAVIAGKIQASGGAIAFDDYMRMALYEPGLGYYAGPAVEFGAAGDFVTAPEVSPLFGQCLASQVRDLIAQDCAARILEFGAGSGRLCAQILGELPDLEQYCILDLGADLKHRQRDYLATQMPRDRFRKVEWLSELPEGFDGIVIANEVIDAMPVKLMVRRSAWHELGIAQDNDRFAWCEFDAGQQARDAMLAVESQLGELPEGYTCELNLNLGPWFEALASCCNRAVVFVIDYGYERDLYYHRERSGGTLCCHYRQRVHFDPLIYPGLQDITAFVDFDACADAAENAGFSILGLVTQAEFLIANGLLEAAQSRADKAGDIERIELASQVRTLSLPEEMGEKFKVMALAFNLAPDLPAMERRSAYG